ncbi:DUF2637 domain-containing protein [Micromonospora sp. R77]|uniref:DUF2637 domain-containing protein n=1 Tax=Micromonospora sp. R77 TaxID=2925836 RepID=UPI0027E06C55|nr:DUF2637 domain-containing protein [Micromonospora sp. R77]
MTAPTTPTTPDNAATRYKRSDDTGVHLRRLRWAIRATLTLGVAASVAANVLHARPNPISQIIAAWPPLALLLTVELISRVPHHRRSLGAIRITATSLIAAIATWVSYWHLVGVAARYGETDAGAAYLLPISVDGLVIVASVSLVDITARIRTGHAQRPSQPVVAAQSTTPTPLPKAASNRDAAGQARIGAPIKAAPPAHTPRHHARSNPVDGETAAPDHLDDSSEARTATVNAPNEITGKPESDKADAEEVVPSETASAVAYWHRRDPTLHPADIAARIGRSERTVRRYWPPLPSRAPSGNANRGATPTRGVPPTPHAAVPDQEPQEENWASMASRPPVRRPRGDGGRESSDRKADDEVLVRHGRTLERPT